MPMRLQSNAVMVSTTYRDKIVAKSRERKYRHNAQGRGATNVGWTAVRATERQVDGDRRGLLPNRSGGTIMRVTERSERAFESPSVALAPPRPHAAQFAPCRRRLAMPLMLDRPA
jgi:hypothetical protein